MTGPPRRRGARRAGHCGTAPVQNPSSQGRDGHLISCRAAAEAQKTPTNVNPWNSRFSVLLCPYIYLKIKKKKSEFRLWGIQCRCARVPHQTQRTTPSLWTFVARLLPQVLWKKRVRPSRFPSESPKNQLKGSRCHASLAFYTLLCL